MECINQIPTFQCAPTLDFASTGLQVLTLVGFNYMVVVEAVVKDSGENVETDWWNRQAEVLVVSGGSGMAPPGGAGGGSLNVKRSMLVELSGSPSGDYKENYSRTTGYFWWCTWI